MDSVSMIVTLAIQLGVGKLIKVNPKLANGIIFWVNWGVAIIANAGLKIVVPEAHAASTGSIAHTVGNTIFTNPFILGFIQSLFATGIHSTAKNTWQMLKGTFGFRTP
jgi:hypothetical protein